MLNVNAEIDGYSDIKRVLDNIIPAINQAVEQIANTIKEMYVARTPYATGRAKYSWSPVLYQEGGYSFSSDSDYIMALDRGSDVGSKPWPGEGPKTTQVGNKIYSSRLVDSKGLGISDPIMNNNIIKEKLVESVVEKLKDLCRG